MDYEILTHSPYEKGVAASLRDYTIGTGTPCPYAKGTNKYTEWYRGYMSVFAIRRR
jgi:hypothetical protein